MYLQLYNHNRMLYFCESRPHMHVNLRQEKKHISVNTEKYLPAEWLLSLQTDQWHCRKFRRWGSWQRDWRSEHQQGLLHCPRCQHRCHRRGLRSQQWGQHQTWSNLQVPPQTVNQFHFVAWQKQIIFFFQNLYKSKYLLDSFLHQ